jgi:hypothetical protein
LNAALQFWIGIVHRLLMLRKARYISLNTASLFSAQRAIFRRLARRPLLLTLVSRPYIFTALHAIR